MTKRECGWLAGALLAGLSGCASALDSADGLSTLLAGLAGGLLIGLSLGLAATIRKQASLSRWDKDFSDGVGVVLWRMDLLSGRYLHVSRRAEALLGYPCEAWLTEGFWRDHLHPEDREFACNLRSAQLALELNHEIEYRMVDADGCVVAVRDTASVLRDRNGRITGLAGLLIDMTAHRALVQALDESERRFQLMFEKAEVGLALRRVDGHFTQVNPKFRSILGYSEAELLRLDFNALTYPDDLPAELSAIAACLAGQQTSYSLEKRYIQRSGATVWTLITSSLIRDESGNPVQFMSVIEDISQRKDNEEQIAWLAHHDSLTDLPNRALLRDRLTRSIARALRSESRAALLVLDLDRFKTINDSLGHAIGDLLLQQVALRLKSAVRETDTVSRQGGDEFLIVLGEISDLDDIARIVQKVLEKMESPFELAGQMLSSTASIGISVYPDDGADCETLLKNADSAMYCAKEGGRNTFRFYAEAMNQTALDRLKLENALRFAIERGELSLHYQPQVDLAERSLLGVEALLRWNCATLGSIPPGRFIPIAEDCGLIVSIGQWVLIQACEQVKRWREEGLGDICVAVNLSALQFLRSDIVATVREAIEGSAIAANLIELELTESLLMQNAEDVLQTMRELKALGVRLSIDDFGTGYSSLSYLKRFPVDRLKVDRSFVKDAAENPEDAAIVRAIIQLGKSLKLDVIAEGAETEAQIDFLTAEGCHSVQGYYFARPLPEKEVRALLGLAAIPPAR